MEVLRVRAKYAELGGLYGVAWKGREYDKSNWNLADDINRALSAANTSLYAVCAAATCSLGYIPSLGFVHDSGTLPFIYDVADLYKEVTSFPAALQAEVDKLEMPNWHFKLGRQEGASWIRGLWRQPCFELCLHRAGCM
jgi:CRISPR-associated protein Cas1